MLSQNGKQKAENKYSHTLYDSIGRIVEVGQVENTTIFPRDSAVFPASLAVFIHNGTRTEIGRTFYDKPLLATLAQTNLRNRIAAVTYNDTLSSDLVYQTATHYSYDIHGNVKRLVQNIPALSTFARHYINVDYEYDLVSGNVNKVWYQKGKPEQFMHRYRYDADNKLTYVYTSNTINVRMRSARFIKSAPQVYERLEARYCYLPNGMLSRAETGQKQIQGTDYAYTLQGWLKDINGYRTDTVNRGEYDIGRDAMHCVSTNKRVRNLYAESPCRDAMHCFSTNKRVRNLYAESPCRDAMHCVSTNKRVRNLYAESPCRDTMHCVSINKRVRNLYAESPCRDTMHCVSTNAPTA